MRLRESPEKARSPLRWVGRLLVLLIAVFTCLLASLFLFTSWQDTRLDSLVELSSAARNLNPLQVTYLKAFLAINAEALQAPAGNSQDSTVFVIEPGRTAQEIATELYQAGLLTDTELFLRYVQYQGLDSQLDAGKYLLNPGMSTIELAQSLAQAGIVEVTLNFLDGWRIAEMVEYLAAVNPAQIDPVEFARLAERRVPYDLSPFGFLESVPAGSSLEGYLYPDSYTLPVDAEAADLIGMMLTRFGLELSDQLRSSFAAHGLTIHEAVTMASIIEKETKVTTEKPLMASVYLNRLRDGMLLQADPSVQYVVGYDEETQSWWKSPLEEGDLRIDSPYNTYLYAGLPPNPMNNPSLASLQAVAAPPETDYLFFVADCDAEVAGSHAFSHSFEEHLEKVNHCRAE